LEVALFEAAFVEDVAFLHAAFDDVVSTGGLVDGLERRLDEDGLECSSLPCDPSRTFILEQKL
jgi:hypothetical protein